MNQREIKFRSFHHNIMSSPYWLGSMKAGDLHGGIIMQFTGLKDMNGKDIYEGDILEVEIEPFVKKKLPVFMKNGCWAIGQDTKFGFLYHYTLPKEGMCMILGNIYEHPHIL